MHEYDHVQGVHVGHKNLAIKCVVLYIYMYVCIFLNFLNFLKILLFEVFWKCVVKVLCT